MAREKGTVVEWNRDRKYGFIRPDNSAQDKIFLYTKSLPHYQRDPEIGDLVTYVVGVDENNRYCAFAAKIGGVALSRFTLISIGMALLMAIYLSLVALHKLPIHPVAIYAGVSLITIWAYSKDKRAAELGRWRISEFKLHLLEIAGGWPGALLAQRCYRHKVRKISYQIVFWIIVAGHGSLWYYLLNHKDLYYSNWHTAINYAQVMAEGVKWEIETLLSPYYKGYVAKERSHTETVEHTTATATQGSSTEVPLKREISPKRVRIVKGIIKEIRSQEGIVVSLQTVAAGMEGTIDRSLLARNFATRFKPGDHIQVGIRKITMRGDIKDIELMLIEK